MTFTWKQLTTNSNHTKLIHHFQLSSLETDFSSCFVILSVFCFVSTEQLNWSSRGRPIWLDEKKKSTVKRRVGQCREAKIRVITGWKSRTKHFFQSLSHLCQFKLNIFYFCLLIQKVHLTANWNVVHLVPKAFKTFIHVGLHFVWQR